MPEFVPTQVAEVTVIGSLQGQACVNRWHFGTSTAHVDTDDWELVLIQLANAMLQCVVEKLLPAVTSNYTAIRVEAKNVGPLVSDPAIATANPGSVGLLGPTSVSFASTLVNLRTGRDGKRGRGKKYFPPPGEANVTDSEVDEGTLISLAEFLACVAEKFVGAGATQEWVLGVVSQKDRKSVGGNYLNSFRAVKQMNPSALLAVKASRKKGRGA